MKKQYFKNDETDTKQWTSRIKWLIKSEITDTVDTLFLNIYRKRRKCLTYGKRLKMILDLKKKILIFNENCTNEKLLLIYIQDVCV